MYWEVGLVIQQLSDGNGGFHVGGLAACEEQLRREGFEAPGWRDLAHGLRPGAQQEAERTVGVAPGWQHEATDAVLIHFLKTSVRPRLTLVEQALLRRAITISRFESSVFRVLLLRGLWLPLPPSTRKCRCGRLLAVHGHHRAACAVVGVLGRRGFPVESAAARVCREAGACVGTLDGHDCCPQSVQPVSQRLSWSQSRSATPSVALEVRHHFWRTCLGRIQGDCGSIQIDLLIYLSLEKKTACR